MLELCEKSNQVTSPKHNVQQAPRCGKRAHKTPILGTSICMHSFAQFSALASVAANRQLLPDILLGWSVYPFVLADEEATLAVPDAAND